MKKLILCALVSLLAFGCSTENDDAWQVQSKHFSVKNTTSSPLRITFEMVGSQRSDFACDFDLRDLAEPPAIRIEPGQTGEIEWKPLVLGLIEDSRVSGQSCVQFEPAPKGPAQIRLCAAKSGFLCSDGPEERCQTIDVAIDGKTSEHIATFMSDGTWPQTCNDSE